MFSFPRKSIRDASVTLSLANPFRVSLSAGRPPFLVSLSLTLTYPSYPETSMSASVEKAVFSKQEVAANNSKDSCWMVIRGKVYDVTAFLEEVLAPHCILYCTHRSLACSLFLLLIFF